MGRIELENMEFYAFHGCYREEKIVGNLFLVDLVMDTDCAKAAETDDINDALSYLTAYQLVEKEVMQNANLLENVAKRILDSLFENFAQLNYAKVKVSKMNPPLGGRIEKVSLVLERKR